jgi:hypothetical protein
MLQKIGFVFFFWQKKTQNYRYEDTALLFPFLSESVKDRFPPRVDTFSSDILFIVSKQYACSRRAHIEGHMNRGGYYFKVYDFVEKF